MSRRAFIQTTSLATAALASGSITARAQGVAWPIGCFNRPWMQKFGSHQQPLDTPAPANWGFDAALKGTREAGYKTIGLLTPMPGEAFIAAASTDEYIAHLQQRIADSGLVATMGSLRVKEGAPMADAVADVHKQIDHARFLKLEWLLTFGFEKQKNAEAYYKLMTDAADYAEQAGLKLVMKPHGGGSGASQEIKTCLSKVNRPNFKIWYDAANIIYYTGKDPIEELKPIVQYVTGFCAKDCGGKSQDVMIQFGTGKVDFTGVFTELKKAGFNGPVFVECAGGKSYDEVTAGARENRLFLEKVFASI
jgi:sugar phosphate isomerase/epimerase